MGRKRADMVSHYGLESERTSAWTIKRGRASAGHALNPLRRTPPLSTVDGRQREWTASRRCRRECDE